MEVMDSTGSIAVIVGAGTGAAAEAVEPLMSEVGLKWSSLSLTHSRVPSKRFSTNPAC